MLPHDQRGTRERSQRDGFAFAVTIGELYLFPIGLSLVSKIAPARMISTMMGLWLGTSFVGNFVAGWLGSFWSSMDKMSYYDRRCHGERRHCDLVLPSPAQRYPALLAPVRSDWAYRLSVSLCRSRTAPRSEFASRSAAHDAVLGQIGARYQSLHS
jgi:hypothetical protein